jgi:hypothetical protein
MRFSLHHRLTANSETHDCACHEGRDENLPECSGRCNASDSEQIPDMKMQPDAEHQQDHADVGQLVGESRIRVKAGRIGPATTPARR